MTDERSYVFKRPCGSTYTPLSTVGSPNINTTIGSTVIPSIIEGECSEDLLRQFNYVRRTDPCACPNYRVDADGLLVDDNPEIERRPGKDQPDVRSEQKVGICLLKPIPDVSFT